MHGLKGNVTQCGAPLIRNELLLFSIRILYCIVHYRTPFSMFVFVLELLL